MMKSSWILGLFIAALLTVGWLMPSCVNTGNNLAGRVATLEKEVEALKATYPFRAYLNHSQTIQRGTPTKIQLDAVTYDPSGRFDPADHSYRVAVEGDYLMIGEVWYDYGARDGGVHSVQIRKNNDIIIERDDMCADSGTKDIQPHCADIVHAEPGDRFTLWTVFYKGGPCQLKTVERQNYLTVIKLN